MKLFFELQEQAKRSIIYNYRCEQCVHYKQLSQLFEPLSQDITKSYYYHICNITKHQKDYNDWSCEYFEPNDETLVQYRLDIQEKLQELMYEEVCDKLYDHIM